MCRDRVKNYIQRYQRKEELLNTDDQSLTLDEVSQRVGEKRDQRMVDRLKKNAFLKEGT